jgi:hypothetical protein
MRIHTSYHSMLHAFIIAAAAAAAVLLLVLLPFSCFCY